jgi:hypothetical protein
MLISSPAFVIDSYKDWYTALVEKNQENLSMIVTKQDISVGGMIKRLTHHYDFNDMIVMAVAAVTLLTEMIIAFFTATKKIWLLLLSSLLLGIVLFSSSSESATYIIALAGIGIWYVASVPDHPKTVSVLTLLAVFFTSICSTDLVPHYIKSHYIIGYSLKALPCFLVWLFIAWQMIILFIHRRDQQHASEKITIN